MLWAPMPANYSSTGDRHCLPVIPEVYFDATADGSGEGDDRFGGGGGGSENAFGEHAIDDRVIRSVAEVAEDNHA